MSSPHDSRPPYNFEFNISVPADARFAVTVRDLAVHAAEHIGTPRPQAVAFGADAEALLLRCLEDAPRCGPRITVSLRCESGPLELLLDRRRLTLDV